MNETRLDISKLAPIDVYVTPNVAVWRQLGMWQDREKRYTFVPTQSIGYVIVAESDRTIECEILKGYTLMRPAGLELAWDTDKPVTFRTLSMAEATEWELRTRKVSWSVFGGALHP